MAEKHIQIKNLLGDDLFPKTKGAVVINNSGANLGDVEAGAQVNKIEKIKIDGVELKIVEKVAEYTTPKAAEYTLEKETVAEEGMAATYTFKKDGVQVGDKINIAKDQVLQNVELKQCEEENTPVEPLIEGDYYLEFTFQNKETPIYLPVKNLMDVYTNGDGLTLEGNKFSINTADTKVVDTVVTSKSTKLVQSGAVYTAVDTVQKALDAHAAEADKHVSTAEKTKWDGKQDAIADLEDIRSNATAGKGAADAIAEYGDIVSHNADEFQKAITAEAKLSADNVDDAETTNKFVTAEDKTRWNTKQDALLPEQIEALDKIDSKADDNAVVHLAEEETITGVKTFSVSPLVPTAEAKDNSTKAASTAFVTNAISGFLTYEELEVE